MESEAVVSDSMGALSARAASNRCGDDVVDAPEDTGGMALSVSRRTTSGSRNLEETPKMAELCLPFQRNGRVCRAGAVTR
jgi:hypothetical protein